MAERVRQLEEKEQSGTVIQFADSKDLGQVAKTIDFRIKELENENRSLTMNRSQCLLSVLNLFIVLQNKHILEQQMDEVIKESNKAKSENTKLKLHLQVFNFEIVHL